MILLVILLIIAVAIVVVLLNKLITVYNERKDNEKPNKMQNIIDDHTKTANDMFDKFEQDSFNSTFEFHVGENYGSRVKNTLDDVITNKTIYIILFIFLLSIFQLLSY